MLINSLIYFSIYREPDWLIQRTIINLLKIGYKNIIVRFDGIHNSNLVAWLLHFGVCVFQTERLKKKGKGGLVTHNYFGLFLGHKSNSEWLIKIDPDTLPLRTLQRNPETNVGCNFHTENSHIYGGCIVIHRKLVKRIFNSQILLTNKYQRERYLYRHYTNEYLPCQDRILFDIFQNIGEKIDPFNDVIYCRNERDKILNPTKSFISRFCFYHPIK